MGVPWKMRFLGVGGSVGGGHGKPIYRGNCLNKGRSSTVCRFKDKETCNKRGGSVFETGEGGWYPNAHYNILL